MVPKLRRVGALPSSIHSTSSGRPPSAWVEATGLWITISPFEDEEKARRARAKRRVVRVNRCIIL